MVVDILHGPLAAVLEKEVNEDERLVHLLPVLAGRAIQPLPDCHHHLLAGVPAHTQRALALAVVSSGASIEEARTD